MTVRSSRFPKLGRGVLENSGLGEVAFFLKKARQNVEYAKFALDHADFPDDTSGLDLFLAKVESMNNLMIEVQSSLEKATYDMVVASEEAAEKASEEE